MNLIQLKPRKALNKAFLKVKANRNDIELVKTNLIKLVYTYNYQLVYQLYGLNEDEIGIVEGEK